LNHPQVVLAHKTDIDAFFGEVIVMFGRGRFVCHPPWGSSSQLLWLLFAANLPGNPTDDRQAYFMLTRKHKPVRDRVLATRYRACSSAVELR
jgi:hypothetical protein